MNTTENGKFEGPLKVYNEKFEKQVISMVMSNVKKEHRTDGELAYTVIDLQGLIIEIMELAQNYGKSK